MNYYGLFIMYLLLRVCTCSDFLIPRGRDQPPPTPGHCLQGLLAPSFSYNTPGPSATLPLHIHPPPTTHITISPLPPLRQPNDHFHQYPSTCHNQQPHTATKNTPYEFKHIIQTHTTLHFKPHQTHLTLSQSPHHIICYVAMTHHSTAKHTA